MGQRGCRSEVGTNTPNETKNRQCVWRGLVVRFPLSGVNIYILMTPQAGLYLVMLCVWVISVVGTVHTVWKCLPL